MTKAETIKKGLKCHVVGCEDGFGCEECRFDNPYHDPEDIMADALALIEELEKRVPKWISVGERTPKKDDRVLYISIGRGQIYVGAYKGSGSRGAHYFSHSNRLDTALYWMPLPEGPEV